MGGFFYINKFLVDIVEKSYFTDRNRKLSALESKYLLVIITTDIVRKTQKNKKQNEKIVLFPILFRSTNINLSELCEKIKGDVDTKKPHSPIVVRTVEAKNTDWVYVQ